MMKDMGPGQFAWLYLLALSVNGFLLSGVDVIIVTVPRFFIVFRMYCFEEFASMGW